MDQRLRQHLITLMDHQSDLALRDFAAKQGELYASLAASGRFFSGMRIKLCVGLIRKAVEEFSETALATARSRGGSLASFGLAAEKSRALFAIFEEELPRIVYHPNGDPRSRSASPSAFDAAKTLLEQIRADLETKLKIAAFDFSDVTTLTNRLTPDVASEGSGVAVLTIPNGYMLLSTAYQELLNDVQLLVRPIDNEASSFPAQKEEAEWAGAIRTKSEVEDALRGSIQHTHPYPGLALWTRASPFLEPEQIDWGPLASTVSVNWQGTIITGRLLVFSDPALKPIDRWPMFVHAGEWKGAKRALSAIIAPPVDAAPRLPDGQLQQWWDNLGPAEQALPQAKLLSLASKRFQEHSIARQRIRDLTQGRKRGRKPLGGKTPAQ
jgi:hypothetical protein